jgi:predicted GIY-YIG superfamily endonuclease
VAWCRVQTYYLYILRCSDGSYYIGHTDDLAARFAKHQAGTYGGYTAKRRPVELVFSSRFYSRDQAFVCERQLKGWSRAKKEALIAGDWDLIHELARCGVRPSER